MISRKAFIPFIVFMVITGFLVTGLSRDPGLVPSPLIDKPAPDFSAGQLFDNTESVSNKDMAGQVWLLNVWASWCAGCREEHPYLVRLSRENRVSIIGLNYKDAVRDAKEWLNKYENPYKIVAVDQSGEIGIDYGVYGVPETFVIDRKGMIRYKHIGPIKMNHIEDIFLPLIENLKNQT